MCGAYLVEVANRSILIVVIMGCNVKPMKCGTTLVM